MRYEKDRLMVLEDGFELLDSDVASVGRRDVMFAPRVPKACITCAAKIVFEFAQLIVPYLFIL